ncbi:unnamed protein product [marine sediment metagenome]|uniref:SpoVT-AbrB domain-containing protein n=1 Tax=marine sediment metagenome TaxID=412755 RepID=X1PP91_9ZZZZ
MGEIDEKGRILVPVYFRERLGLKAGDKVNIEMEKAEEMPSEEAEG